MHTEVFKSNLLWKLNPIIFSVSYFQILVLLMTLRPGTHKRICIFIVWMFYFSLNDWESISAEYSQHFEQHLDRSDEKWSRSLKNYSVWEDHLLWFTKSSFITPRRKKLQRKKIPFLSQEHIHLIISFQWNRATFYSIVSYRQVIIEWECMLS